MDQTGKDKLAVWIFTENIEQRSHKPVDHIDDRCAQAESAIDEDAGRGSSCRGKECIEDATHVGRKPNAAGSTGSTGSRRGRILAIH